MTASTSTSVCLRPRMDKYRPDLYTVDRRQNCKRYVGAHLDGATR